MMTWRDVARMHLFIARGEYRSEMEIWQAEADMINKKFDKGQDARRVARVKAAKPGATRLIQDKRAKLLKRAERKEEQ